MATIKTKGKSIPVKGPLSIIDGKLYDSIGCVIDTNDLEEQEGKSINITIEGNVGSLDVECCGRIIVNGDCNNVNTTGDINCRNINGYAKTLSGNIECEDIQGDAHTISGDIHSKKIMGKAKAVKGCVNGKSNSSYGNTEIHLHPFGPDVMNGETIFGSYQVASCENGKTEIRIDRNSIVNGRKVSEMSEEELREWIDFKAKMGMIVSIY